jgi:TonB family protein
MTHGSQQYFAERARFERRLSAITCVVAATFLALLWIARATPLVDALNDPNHFGFEGPERYADRIEFEIYSVRRNTSTLPYGVNFTANAVRGGGSGHEPKRVHDRSAELARGIAGPGDAPNDLLARALRRSSDTPVVQSEQLVFMRLVRPGYPEEAQKHNIEGRFSVLALIDTSGHVVEVQVQSGDPSGVLEREAAGAVLRCVIRPYLVAGVPREIVARFPFNFYLRD